MFLLQSSLYSTLDHEASPQMKKGGGSKLGRCLGAPFRALSRACDSACALYVRGMSGYARRVPAAAGAVAVGRGFGRPTATTSMHLRESSDRRDDLVRAASKQQRRVAAEPRAVKKGFSQAPALVVLQAQKKGAAGMGTIAENAPCDFGAAGCAPKPRTRGAAVGGLAARAGGFGAIKTGSTEAFARAPSGAHPCYTSAAVCS